MRNRLPALDRLGVFDAAARHLSFTKAAVERHLTQSAVSRQVAALEEELGTALFKRRHRALELTSAGARLAPAVAQALATLREAVEAIRAPRGREVLSLTTTPGFASLWLIPRLSRFVAESPGIDVRIDASYEVRALGAEEFDIAIRYDRIGRSEGEPLFAEAVLPLAAPSLLKGGKPLRTLADLAHHRLLQLATQNEEPGGMPLDWKAWLKSVGASGFEPAAVLTFTSYDTAIAAALEGQGLVLGRRPLVDRLIEQGKLVAPFTGQTASERGYFIVVDAAAAARPAALALVRWLHAQARGVEPGDERKRQRGGRAAPSSR
jgi:DNA-binding transcriptional LysR family regulator